MWWISTEPDFDETNLCYIVLRGCPLMPHFTGWRGNLFPAVWRILGSILPNGQDSIEDWLSEQLETCRQSNFKKKINCFFCVGAQMFLSICQTWDLWLTFLFLLKLEGHGPSSDTPVDLSLQPRTNCKSENIIKILPDCMTALWFTCLSLCSTERSGDKWVSPPHAARSPDSQHSHWGQKWNKTVKMSRCFLCVCPYCVAFMSLRTRKTTTPQTRLQPQTPASLRQIRQRKDGMKDVF